MPEASAGSQLARTCDLPGLNVPVARWRLPRRMLRAWAAAARRHVGDPALTVACQGGGVATNCLALLRTQPNPPLVPISMHSMTCTQGLLDLPVHTL
jgi:hypothetical protein